MESRKCSQQCGFFASGASFYGRAGQESRKALPVLARSANLFSSAHPFLAGGRRFDQIGLEQASMTTASPCAPAHAPARTEQTQPSSVFNFGDQPVRIVTIDGEPWFVAKDVCTTLGYRDAEKGTRNLGTHQKGVHDLRTPGGDQRVTIINEPGLYRLVLRSRKPEAVAFSDWVASEVLPSIRKTGTYSAPRPAPESPNKPARVQMAFMPAKDQSRVSHLRVTVDSYSRHSNTHAVLHVTCGDVGFAIAINAPTLRDFASGEAVVAEYPKGRNPLNTQFTALYRAHLKPEPPSSRIDLRRLRSRAEKHLSHAQDLVDELDALMEQQSGAHSPGDTKW